MLGSHDTFTYLSTPNILAKMFPIFWKCQKLTLQEQYDAGVRLFDVRVSIEDSDGFLWWRVGHGFAKVEQRFVSLRNICLYFKNEFPEAIIRIILENGGKNKNIVAKFKREADGIVQDFSQMIWTIIIKHPWETLYVCNKFDEVVDTCCRLFNWNLDKGIIENLKKFDKSSWSIKKWSKKHNPNEITNKMKTDNKKLYFMDYVGVYPKL